MTTGVKLSPREARESHGMTVRDLAAETGLSETTIYRLEDDNWTQATREEVAEIVARCLGRSVDEISWPRGTSRRGRLPHTGATFVITAKVTITEVCPSCFLELPASGSCGFCAT